MNVLFVSISPIPKVAAHSISLDLLRVFRNHGHKVYIVCALERKNNQETSLHEEDGCQILRVKVGNNKKANIIEKGITTVFLPNFYIKAIKQYYADVKFDLVLYPTPPVTQVKTVEFIKKRDGAMSYLMLKDIFPQNAVDIGMMSKSGAKGILYKYFRMQEKKLYALSDHIGCMSQANVDYVLKHNPEVEAQIVEVCPNSIEIVDKSVDTETRKRIREKYGIPQGKKVFVYGGNLGKPQGIHFLIKCLKKCANIEDVFFLIVGDGTEYKVLDEYVKISSQKNLKLMSRLPREDYDSMVGACDVGMIFLDHRFTIPNFPSRLLSYMQAKLPILACTDPNTDIGKVITDGGFGWWCESNDEEAFINTVNIITALNLKKMGEQGYQYMLSHYSVEDAYTKIISHV